MKSFKEYIKNRFDNHFWKVTENYVYNDLDIDSLNLYKLRQIGEIEIENIQIEHIWCYDQPEMRIKFNVAFSVDLIVHEGNYRYDDYQECKIWLLSECDGDISKNLNDFNILSTGSYNGKSYEKSPLDDSLVPVISKGELDSVAESILKKYYPEVLSEPVFLDPMKLAKTLGLTVKSVNITKEGSIFGRCFFEDTVTEIYDVKEETLKSLKVTAGTILVDKNNYFLSTIGVKNNTIVHECLHWILHSKSFALARLYDRSLSNISCQVSGGIEGSSKESVRWMEWQANALTPKLQMPKDSFLKQVEKTITSIRSTSDRFDDIDYIEPLIDSLAQHFGVSRTAVKIRLIECGYEVAKNAFVYIDGKYVKPHRPARKIRLKNNETYSIPIKDAIILSYFDPEFREKSNSGQYIYIDSHFVLNLPLYVQENIFGELELTDYARKHMNECCLVFDLEIKNEFHSDYRTECFLNRDRASNVSFTYKFNNGYENSTEKKQQEAIKEAIQETASLYRKMTVCWNENLQMLRDYFSLTNKELAERTQLNENTIGRCLKDGAASFNTIILICLALHIPPMISGKIINDCPYNFDINNEDHLIYQFVLMHMYGHTMDKIREEIKKQGATLL